MDGDLLMEGRGEEDCKSARISVERKRVERKAVKGGKRDASASRSELCRGCRIGWRASHGILV